MLAALALDGTIISVALPTIRNDLGGGARAIQWIASVYFLAAAVVLIPAGRMVDLVGARRVIVGGGLVYVAGCVLGALSVDSDRGPWRPRRRLGHHQPRRHRARYRGVRGPSPRHRHRAHVNRAGRRFGARTGGRWRPDRHRGLASHFRHSCRGGMYRGRVRSSGSQSALIRGPPLRGRMGDPHLGGG